MTLDPVTLFFVSIVVTVVVSIMLFWAWLQNRPVTTLAWWSGTLMLESVGIWLVAMRGEVPDWLSIDIANALLLLAGGLLWVGARRFNGRGLHISSIFGAVLWLIACRFEFFYHSLQLRASMFSTMIGVYILLSASEFWRSDEPLASKPFIVGCLGLHAAAFILNTPVVLLGGDSGSSGQLSSSWFIFVGFQGILHSLMFSFLLLALSKERVELRYKMASRVDPLTGVSNRGYFVTSASDAMEKAGRDDRAVALVVFDLDHFKSINDSMGHQRGDEVLKLFCEIASKQLRASDVFGRLGGEEFAAMLPGVTREGAQKAANRILSAFEAAGEAFPDGRMRLTASAGIAVSVDGSNSFEELFSAADRALYRAKHGGRNRVEDAGPVAPGKALMAGV